MLNADTKSLQQQTNISYINLIRLRELQYYSSFYLTFAGQAAIVGGFSFAAITQINFSNFCNPLTEGLTFYSGGGTAAPTPSPTEYYETLISNSVGSCQGKSASFYITIQDLFWIAQAITMALAFRVMVHSVLLLTVGPMKAFSGKKGSIVSVIQELEKNKYDLFKAFACMILAFLSSILCYIFIGLRQLPGLFQNCIAAFFFVIMLVLYYTSYHSYQEFVYKKEKMTLWKFTLQLLHSFFDSKPAELKSSKISNVNSFLKNLELNEVRNNITLRAVGHMRKKTDKKILIPFSKLGGENLKFLWKDRFFLLIENQWGNLDLYYYREQSEFIRQPEFPLKERPIQLNDYNMEARDNGNNKVLFELHPKEGKNITRVWTFEANKDEHLWQLIKEKYEESNLNKVFDNRNSETNNNTTSNSLFNPILEGQHIQEDL